MKIIKQSLTKKHIKIKKTTTLRKGFYEVNLSELKQQRFDGTWTPLFKREFIKKQSAIAVLPYDPKKDCVVLIEQFRIGALEHNATPWLIEIVAGVMDKGEKETHEDVARRETLEETGLKIESLIPIYDYFTSAGYSTEKIKLFCAKVDSTKAPKYCGLKEEHEDIKIHVVPTTKAFAAVRSGQINNSFTIIALQWLELNLKTVKKRFKNKTTKSSN
jgi:ADP-ribose pyrophosphatase